MRALFMLIAVGFGAVASAGPARAEDEAPPRVASSTTSTAAMGGGGGAPGPVATATVALPPAPPNGQVTRCSLKVTGGSGKVGLELWGLEWDGWSTMCFDLVRYINPGPAPYADNVRAEAERTLL